MTRKAIMTTDRPNHRRLRFVAVVVGAVVAVGGFPSWAFAQKQLADDLIILNAGQRAIERERSAGIGEPGSDYNRLSVPVGALGDGIQPLPEVAPPFARNRDPLAAASDPIATASLRPRAEIIPVPAPIAAAMASSTR